MSSTTQRRPQLTLDELQQLKWLLGGLLTLLAVGTVFYMDVEARTLMALTTVATVAVLIRPTLPARVPAFVHTLAFPVIVAFFAADLWLLTEVLPAMVRLDILLLLYRTTTYRQRRDDLQIVVLGLFLIVVAGVLTVSLTFAAQILVYTACALGLLLAITMTETGTAAARAAAARRKPGVAPGWAVHVNWLQLFRRLRQVSDWRLVFLGGLLFTGVVVISALLFLAIPRFQLENSMFLDRFISKKAKSGFSDTIRFGDVTEIQQDTSVALSVDVSDQAQIPALPYWRILVLDLYHNGTFRFSRLLKSELGGNRTSSFVYGDGTPRQGGAVYWTFYFESGVSRYLPLLSRFELLRFREAQNFQIAPSLGVVALREEPVTMTAFRVEGFEPSGVLPDPAFAQRWRDRELPGQRQGALQFGTLPRDADRAELARLVTEATGGERLSAGDFAQRTGAWLRNQHGYSLAPSIPAGDGDPLVRWLASREAGHCELFAGGFVLLAWQAGFPARVATGFKGGTWNGYSNNFTIRNSDAHAWAEIFDVATGAWLRVDPLEVSAGAQADAARGEETLARRLDRSWAARLDSLRVFWYRRIVSFDQRSQAETLKAVKESTQQAGRRLREALDGIASSISTWLMAPWDLRRFSAIVGVAGLLAGLVWLWHTWGRALWLRLRGGRGGRGGIADPTRREAGQWLFRLTQAGGRLPPPDRPPAAPPRDNAVVADLQRLRFGARATWPDARSVFQQARRTLRETRRARENRTWLRAASPDLPRPGRRND